MMEPILKKSPKRIMLIIFLIFFLLRIFMPYIEKNITYIKENILEQ